MPTIQRNRPSKHIVVVDTNILWHEDKTLSVNPDFDNFWTLHQHTIPLDLYIPEVVFGELCFQQTTSALGALEKLTVNFKHISGVAQAAYRNKISPQKLKNQVHQKLMRWVAAKNAKIIPVPHGETDWPALIQCAIWRESPFTFDKKNNDNEKGFRDSLILETLNGVAKSVSSNFSVVFICNDYVLRQAAESRLADKRNCLFFEGLKDFESYINLTQEKLTNQFVRQIQTRARSKFFNAKDPACLYITQDVPGRITKDFKEEIEKPELSQPSTGLRTGLLFGLSSVSWVQSHAQYWITAPRFGKLEADRKFFWVSRVTLVKLYVEGRDAETNTTNTLAKLLEPSTQRLLLLGFDVTWTATVKNDGRFHDLTLQEIVLAERSFNTPTPDELKRWKLDITDT